MKKLIVLFCLLVASAVHAQAPQYLNYQGVARDASGNIINTIIGLKFEIIQGSPGGTVVYEETNTSLPSSVGIFTNAIGSGAIVTGNFSTINWAAGPYFIRVSIDPAGGTSFNTVGTSELLSVPYALYAETAGNTQTVNITGSGVSGAFPNYTITAPGVLTPSTGISISGGTITNTAPDQTVTLAAAGISSVTGTYPSYTIDVPPPALNYNTSTNVLTLTQGTAVATTTLVGAGSSTVAMFASGIASVTPVGAGSNFTVSVQTPTLTGAGSTTVSGTYPNYVISTPGASTATPTSLQINAPHSTSTLSANNFSINIAPTNISGPGVVGTYPNYTITSAPMTSITAGAPNVIVNGGPSFTISATTPTIQINAPNTVIPTGLNNYSINIPPVNITGAGVATVSGTYPTFTLGVSAPSITASGNTLTITQGTAVSTATFSGGPWAASSGVLYPASNPTNDKVAIGQTVASSNLDVLNAAGSTNTISPVATIVSSNNASTGSSVLNVRNSTATSAQAVIKADNASSNGDGVQVNMSNTSNFGNGIQSSHAGLGNAAYFSVTNPASNAKAIDAITFGNGGAVSAVISNTANTNNALFVSTNGGGPALNVNKSNTGYAISNTHSGTSGDGMFVNLTNASNGSSAIFAQTSGNGDAIAAYNVNQGRALYASSSGTVESALFSNSGTGRSLYASSSNNNDVTYISNTGNGRAIYAINTGTTEVAYFVNTGSARSLMATNNSATSETGFFNNSGNGRGIVIQNPTASPNRAAFIFGGLDIMGKTSGATTFPLVVTNIGSTNLFNVRDDGHVGIGYANPAYRLAVSETGTLAAIYGNNSSSVASALAHGISGITLNTHSLAAGVVGYNSGGTGPGVMGESTGSGPSVYGVKNSSGSVGLFANLATGNASDAMMVSTNGLGSSIHTKNILSAGANNLGLLIEDGHIGSLSVAAPSGSVGVSCTACTGASLSSYANDIAGAFNITMSATFGATFDYTVTYTKPYRKNPVVVITPANLVAGNSGKFYVTNNGGPGNYTGFTVTFIGGISGGAGVAKFNYMVIEASN